MTLPCNAGTAPKFYRCPSTLNNCNEISTIYDGWLKYRFLRVPAAQFVSLSRAVLVAKKSALLGQMYHAAVHAFSHLAFFQYQLLFVLLFKLQTLHCGGGSYSFRKTTEISFPVWHFTNGLFSTCLLVVICACLLLHKRAWPVALAGEEDDGSRRECKFAACVCNL